MPNPKVLISILNWNAAESTVKTVQSVLLSGYDNYTILLLDNNSADNSVEILRNAFPGIQLIKNKKNLGYAGAHKIAAGIAMKENYDLLWILNNDVEVFPATLRELVNAHERNGESLLGSVALDTDRITIKTAGGMKIIDEVDADVGVPYNFFNGKKIDEVDIRECAVSDVGGASFMIPVPVIEQCGFLDTRFFLYGEEVAYCYKLRIQFNIQSIIVPKAIIIHRSGASFGLSDKLPLIKAYYNIRNCYYLNHNYPKDFKMEKNGGLIHFVTYFFRHYFLVSSKNKNMDYMLKHYSKLGAFHALIGLRGKYFEPGNFF